jgi:hypothetical protein
MFKTNNDQYREAIGKTIVNHAGKSPDSNAIAEAAVITWLEMCAQLKPVLGVRGVNILFRRSLHLTKISFPEIEISDFSESDTNLLAGLKNNLTRRETTNALESIRDLLVTFTELLASLIGDPLTKRLLAGHHLHDQRIFVGSRSSSGLYGG